MDMSWKELAAVAVVGAGLAFAAQRVPGVRRMPGFPLLVGAGLYTAGYVVRSQRPAEGWQMPQLSGPVGR